MIGEQINAKLLNVSAAKALIDHLKFLKDKQKYVVAIAGESGSGKTHMATAFKKELIENNIQAYILHMDDFFKLPPASNHAQRILDLAHVGPQEVDLTRLNTLITAFKMQQSSLIVPTVDYYNNSVSESAIDLTQTQVLIIEGTYAFFLKDTDFHLFMSRDFEQTKEMRLARNRGNEAQDEFIERVLRIEHEIIAGSAKKANAYIDYDFNLQFR